MINYYFIYYTTKLNGETIHTEFGTRMCEPQEIREEFIDINWQNLKNFYDKYRFVCGFNIWNTKRGRRIGLFGKAFHDRKEWRHPNTGLTFEIVYQVHEPSIQTILNWHDQREAIRYLKERNLQIGVDK